METVVLHSKLYMFSSEYILCPYPPPKQNKITTQLKLEKQLALYPFLCPLPAFSPSSSYI